MAEENSDEKQLQDLEVALKRAPGDMYTFGLGLRKLFNELQVTGNDEATKKFLSVRDKTREQAVIYVKEVLPSSEEAVKAISSLMDTYTDLDKDEWLESLDKILEELEDARAVCELLRQMHNEIIVELYKNRDEANVGIELLNELDKMKKFGGKLKDKPQSSLHYRAMRNRAPAIIKVCDFFVSFTDRMKNNLEAIPKQPNDQNFVDQWLDQQMLKFKEEHKEEGLLRLFKGSLLKSMVQSARKALDN